MGQAVGTKALQSLGQGGQVAAGVIPRGGKRGQCQNQQKNQGIPHPVPFAGRLCRSGVFRLVRKGLHRQHIRRDRPCRIFASLSPPPAADRMQHDGSCPAAKEGRCVRVRHCAHPAALRLPRNSTVSSARSRHPAARSAPTKRCAACTRASFCRNRPAFHAAGPGAQLFPDLSVRIAQSPKIEHLFRTRHRFQPGFQQSACVRITAYQQPAVRFQRLHRCMNKGHLPSPYSSAAKRSASAFRALAQCRGRFGLQGAAMFLPRGHGIGLQCPACCTACCTVHSGAPNNRSTQVVCVFSSCINCFTPAARGRSY